MALNWRWDEKCGEAIIEQTFGDEVNVYIKNLYEGNAFLIFMNEWKEDNKEMYSLYTFFSDETHAKRCLGLAKGYNNIFAGGCDRLLKIRINKAKSSNWKKIVTLFAQAFDNIDIEIFSEGE